MRWSARAYVAMTLPLVLTAFVATSTRVGAQEGNGCCGEPQCEVLNTPLISCVTSDSHCDANPDGNYGVCCDVGAAGCPIIEG